MEGKPYIKILRKLFHDPMWTEERFSKAQAWIDLIQYAYHSDGNFKWDGLRYDLKRGQLCISEEYLAKRWRWSRARLRRFYKKLEISGMITIQRSIQRSIQHSIQHSIQRKNVITICNYDKIQFKPKQRDTTVDTTLDTTVDTTVVQQTIQQNNKGKEINLRSNLNKPSREYTEKHMRRSQKTKQTLDKLLALQEESRV